MTAAYYARIMFTQQSFYARVIHPSGIFLALFFMKKINFDLLQSRKNSPLKLKKTIKMYLFVTHFRRDISEVGQLYSARLSLAKMILKSFFGFRKGKKWAVQCSRTRTSRLVYLNLEDFVFTVKTGKSPIILW